MRIEVDAVCSCQPPVAPLDIPKFDVDRHELTMCKTCGGINGVTKLLKGGE